MINYYFKQAWTMIRQNKLFSFIYIMGTGLSIALVMIVSIIYYIKLAPIYPEYNRNETIVLKRMKVIKEDNYSSSALSYQFLADMAPKLSNLKHIAAMYNWREPSAINLIDVKESFSVTPLYTNSDFWKVFTFYFIDGYPFNEADVQTTKKKAVISESLSRRLFATTQSAKRTFEMDGEEFVVCGVVKDVSSATPVTAADLWVPITLKSDEYNSNSVVAWMVGPIDYYMLPIDGQKQALKEEIVRLFDEFDLDTDGWQHDLMGQPDDYWVSTFRVWSNRGPYMWEEVFKSIGLMLLAFILIPAINLSGMISSRMDKRLCEIGVRKAYGATRGDLIRQVLWENLILTCVGGLVGLIFSYIIVLTTSSWILTIFDEFVDCVMATSITPEMLFNPYVFLIAFGVCVILNLVSTLIPTIHAMRRSIVYSLNTRK